MAETRKRPTVSWWAVAYAEKDLPWKDVHHATLGTQRSNTLCGLSLVYDVSLPAERRFTSKKMRSRVLPNGKRVQPCARCVTTIERHKQMLGIVDSEWPYETFNWASNKELVNG